MGAFVFGNLTLHDREAVRLARLALRDDAENLIGPDATYVGRTLADHPDIRAAIDGGEEPDVGRDGVMDALSLKDRFALWLSSQPPSRTDDLAAAWDEGYARGIRDEVGDMEAADNPYRSPDAP